MPVSLCAGEQGLAEGCAEAQGCTVLYGTVLYCSVPVVHEDVRGPDVGGGDAQVLDVSVLGLIPPQIVVSPLL